MDAQKRDALASKIAQVKAAIKDHLRRGWPLDHRWRALVAEFFDVHAQLVATDSAHPAIAPRIDLRFPVYVIASRDGVAVVATDGKNCIMLFHARELAERQAAEIQSTHPHLGALYALMVPDAPALQEGLRSLPGEVTCAVWDPAGSPASFNHVGVEDVLLAAERLD